LPIPFAHRAGATNTGAPQQIEQHGFRAIATMVRQRNPVSAESFVGCMPGASGRRLQTIGATALDVDAPYREWNVPSGANVLAKISPAIGVGTESMMHVERRDRPLQGVNDVQEDDRVDSTRQANDHAIPISNVAIETVADE
jgi:hypothetical protein